MNLTPENRDALAVLILRLGLAWFLFVWAVNKLLAPGQYAGIWKNMHGMPIGEIAAYAIGIAQILLCLAMFTGFKRHITYAIAAIVHGFTSVMISATLLAPFVISERGFPVNRNASITVAALGGFIALWLLRHRDHWSLDVMLQRRNPD